MAKKPFYTTDILGGIEKLVDSKLEENSASGIIQSVLGAMVKVQLNGSNKFVDADVINGMIVDMGMTVHLTRNPTTKRWQVDNGTTTPEAVAISNAGAAANSSTTSTTRQNSSNNAALYLSWRMR